MQQFYVTLKTARILRGLKIKEVAAFTGKCIDTISKYERDSTEIPRDLSVKLLKLYNVPERYVFFGKETDLHEFLEEEIKSVS